MSLFPIRVDGTIQCQTTQQLEQHTFSYADATTSANSSETASLHSLVELLTAARNDSNRFFTSMIAKYPKRLPYNSLNQQTVFRHSRDLAQRSHSLLSLSAY